MPDPQAMLAAVHEYVAAFDAASADRVAALYAEDATVEDPIGSDLSRGRAAIRTFYEGAIATGAKLVLQGPVRIAGDHAAFSFMVHFGDGGASRHIDVIDTFRFDADGKVAEMRAFWGPANMVGFDHA